MKHLFLLLFTLTTLCLSAQEIPKLNSKLRNTIVMSVSQRLLDNYVDPDTAIKMSNYIKERNKAGAYDKITDPYVLADRISGDLLSVYHDGHLSVQYNPELEKELSAPAPPIQITTSDAPPKRNVDENFGLQKVEILNGNIGYLNLTHFWADKKYGRQTVKAALKFVSHSNALIIDLRTNGGGSPETVTMICSYFFEKRIHVNDTYSRPTNKTIEFWTEPDSTLPELINMPLYILTSKKTFSAAEEFAYNLKNLKRATIIGETTGGGAHNMFEVSAGNGIVIYMPYGKAVNAVTKTNWEGVGVQPDIAVSADKSLETAEMKIFENMISTTKDEGELFDLNWQFEILKAKNNPMELDAETLKKYAGVYGERTFTFENGKLYYQRTGKPKFEMEAMSQTMMKGKDNTYFKIEFIKSADGTINEVKAYYQDNRIESSFRNEK